MLYSLQGKNDTDIPVIQPTIVNSNNIKRKYLTNSDKSIYNLTWDIGDIKQENNRKNRNQNNYDRLNERKSFENHNEKSSISQSNPYYYPYTYRSTELVKQDNKLKKSKIKSFNLSSEPSTLKIVHHYVDSPKEAQKLIDDLHRKGFIETGIQTPVAYSNTKKNI